MHPHTVNAQLKLMDKSVYGIALSNILHLFIWPRLLSKVTYK